MKILGYGKYAPDKVMTNHDFEKMVETTDEWIVTRTGIERRHIAEEENLSSMAAKAADRAIADAKIDKEDIDMIIVATSTPDEIIPSVSCTLTNLLGIEKEIMCLDLSAACTGFIYALDVADKYLSDEIKNILVVGAEKLSKVLDYTDRNTCILFGDGAGSVVVTHDDSKKVVSYMKASGKKKDSLILSGLNGPEKSFITMNGKDIFVFASKVIPEIIVELLNKANMTIDDIKYIIPHQANYRIIEAAAKKINAPMDKFYINLQEYGNTSAASVVMALVEAKEKDLLRDGDKVLIAGFGGGLTWGGMILEI